MQYLKNDFDPWILLLKQPVLFEVHSMLSKKQGNKYNIIMKKFECFLKFQKVEAKQSKHLHKLNFFLNFRAVLTYFGPHTQKVKKSTIFKKYGHFC